MWNFDYKDTFRQCYLLQCVNEIKQVSEIIVNFFEKFLPLFS